MARNYKRQLLIVGKPITRDGVRYWFSIRYGAIIINSIQYRASNRQIIWPRRAAITAHGFKMCPVILPVYRTCFTGKVRQLIEQHIAQNNVASDSGCANLIEQTQCAQ